MSGTPVHRSKSRPTQGNARAKPAQPAPMIRPRSPGERPALIDWGIVAGVGGTAWLIMLCIVGIILAAHRRPAPSLPANDAAEQSQPADTALIPAVALAPTVPAAAKQALLPERRPSGPEALAVRPRTMPEVPEMLAVEARPGPEAPAKLAAAAADGLADTVAVAVPEVAVATSPAAEPTRVVRAEPAAESPESAAPEEPAAAPPQPETACQRFKTAVDFLATPTQAYDKAKQAKEKLVMILQVAGNFEEPGFT